MLRSGLSTLQTAEKEAANQSKVACDRRWSEISTVGAVQRFSVSEGSGSKETMYDPLAGLWSSGPDRS